MAIDVGDVHRLKWTNTSPAGDPVDGGTVTVTITLPDSTTAGPITVTPTGTGVYQYDYPTVQAGRHVAHWVATSPNPGADVDVFDVRPADLPYIVSLEDVKAQLNITSDRDDEELRSYIEAATEVVERHVGMAIVPRTVTEVHYAHRQTGQGDVDWVYVEQSNRANPRRLALNAFPVLSLISVATLDGSMTWDPDSLHVDAAGVVSVLSGPSLFGDIQTVHRAGMTVTPAHYGLAARIIIQHLWETKRGAARGAVRAGGMGDTLPVPGLGYAIPNRALELLGSGMPGFA